MKTNRAGIRMQAGLTLIELLVAIAIVAILAAIILPALGKAHRAAATLSYTLPPGVSDARLAPLPVKMEHHLGVCWIIAVDRSEGATVVYYPKEVITLNEVRRTQASIAGKETGPSSDFMSVEVFATAKGQDASADFLLELVPRREQILFMGVSKHAMEFLKKKLPISAETPAKK